MAWQMLYAVLNFVLGRVTNLTVGILVTLGGIRHILDPANSLLASFVGLPNVVAFIIGFPVLLIGLMYLLAALTPPGKMMK